MSKFKYGLRIRELYSTLRLHFLNLIIALYIMMSQTILILRKYTLKQFRVKGQKANSLRKEFLTSILVLQLFCKSVIILHINTFHPQTPRKESSGALDTVSPFAEAVADEVLPCILNGNAPVKKNGWNAGAGPAYVPF